MELALMFVTIVISAVMAGLVSYKVNESKDGRRFVGNKAEELYCHAESIDREFCRFFGDRYSLVGAARSAIGSGDEALERAGATLVNAKMLVGFYFPSLAPALARTIAAVTTAHGALRRWEGASGTASGDDLVIALDRDVAALKDALESLKAAIIETGRAASQPASLIVLRRPAKPALEGRVLRVAA
ncbi:MAG TPA: hypothetical protein VGH40_09030 [Roseiarcus sp.]